MTESGSNVRTIKINNANVAAPDSAPANRRRRTNRRKQNGGSEMETPTVDASSAPVSTPVINITKVVPPTPSSSSGSQSGGSSDVKTNIPPGPRVPQGGPWSAPACMDCPRQNIVVANASTGSQVAGGSVETKVVLKKKNRTSKVILKTALQKGGESGKNSRNKLQGSGFKAANRVISGGKKTRRLVVNQVSTRLKKTRSVVKQAKEMPLEDLKKLLIAKKLIKPNSKAPESILRQIYADSLIVGKKTL